MNKHLWLALLIVAPNVVCAEELITQSRVNCVRILYDTNTPTGSGFLLDQQHAATCFHVVASIVQTVSNRATNLQWTLKRALHVELPDGTRVPARLISQPTINDIRPILFDFAVLALDHPVTNGLSLPFYTNSPPLIAGTPILFSGFPLGAPVMLTHRGMISGLTHDQSIIAVDASINRGNSGGALVNTNGAILGIISMREGSLSRELSATRDVIRKMEKRMGRIEFGTDIGNVSPLDLTLRTIDTVDTFISTGIGYATSIRFLDAYLREHPLTTSNKIEKAQP